MVLHYSSLLMCLLVACKVTEPAPDADDPRETGDDDTAVSTDSGPGGDDTAEGDDDTSLGSVDVVLAVGEMSVPSCYFAGDMNSDATGCKLVRLTYDLDTGEMTSHTDLVDDPSGGGTWQPSVSKDGLQLAFAYVATEHAAIRTRELAASATDAGVEVSPGGDVHWTWPNWGPDGTLAASRRDDEPACLAPDDTCSQIERWNHTYLLDPAGSGEPTYVGGATGHAWDDAWLNPMDTDLVAGHGKLHTTALDAYPVCDPDDLDASVPCTEMVASPQPLVTDRSTGQLWAFELVTTEAAYAGTSLEGCAHLAWSPDGTRLLCTEQGTSVFSNDLTARIHVFDFDRASATPGEINTVDTAPLFEHQTSNELFAGEECDIYYHKHAEWCVEDVVVATQGCACTSDDCKTESGAGSKLIATRVVLLDVRDPGVPVYHDLTSQLEAAGGHSPGDLTSFTATCVPPTAE